MKIKQIKVGSLETNCYILTTKENILIIDPGAEPNKILENIEDKTKKATIINTHYHYDHTFANDEIKKTLHAEILIHKGEEKYIDFHIDRFLNTDETLNYDDVELKIIHTPGHTKGSICLLGNGFIFSGDTLFENGYGRTDLTGGDTEQMMESLKKLESIINQRDIVYPGHGDSFKWEELSLVC